MVDIEPLSFLFEGKKDLVVAEIGVSKGNSTVFILDNFDIKKYYAIDPFQEYKDYTESSVSNYYKANGGADAVYLKTKVRLSKYDNVELIRAYSDQAVKLIEDNELDICFIDGNHAYNYVFMDIKWWSPKVKVDGIICGDDSFNPVVLLAVKDFFKLDYDLFIGKRSWFVKKWKEIYW